MILTLKQRVNGEEFKTFGVFNNNQIDKMAEYLKCAELLLETDFIRKTQKINFEFKWHCKYGEHFSFFLPNSKDSASFMHRMRPLIYKKSKYSFNKIESIFTKNICYESRLDLYLKTLRKTYQQSGPLGFFFNNEPLVTDKKLNNWLKAYEYHPDKELQKVFEEIQKKLPGDILKHAFMVKMRYRSQAILCLANLIANMKNREGKYFKNIIIH